MPVIAIMNLTLFPCFFVSLFLCVFQLCDNTFEFSTLIREMQTVTTSTASDPSYTLALDVPNTAATWIDYDVTAKTWIVISARVINKDDPTPTADLPKLASCVGVQGFTSSRPPEDEGKLQVFSVCVEPLTS